MSKKIIKQIVCTGGPCSGKSTFMSRAEEVFAERGYRVLIDHEAATDLITGGISPATMGMYEFQKYCIGLQLKKEELFRKAAENIKADKVLILYDRGILDDKGYVSPEEFTELLSQFGVTETQCRDNYDMVMHLVTAAKGSNNAYTLENNAGRYEDAAEAVRVDDTIAEGWKGHRNIVYIQNEDDFELKMRKAIQAIFTYLKEEKPVETSRKFLVEADPEVVEELKKTAMTTNILQHYLKSQSGNERRIRRREQNGNTIYYYSEANNLSGGQRIKRDRIISGSQYDEYFTSVDDTLSPIDKVRYSFYLGQHFCRYDIFSFDQTKAILTIQIPDECEDIVIPGSFKVIKEVTDIINYSNYYLAKTQKF